MRCFIDDQEQHLNQSGVTLIELVIVMVIVGIMSYFAVANINNADTSIKSSTTLEKIAADVRYAQQVAVADRKETRVYIDPGSNRYYLTWSDLTYLKKPIGATDFIVYLGSGEYSGVQITSTSFTGGRVDFTRTGEPLNAGAGFAGELILVTIGGKHLKIQAGTGMVTVVN